MRIADHETVYYGNESWILGHERWNLLQGKTANKISKMQERTGIQGGPVRIVQEIVGLYTPLCYLIIRNRYPLELPIRPSIIKDFFNFLNPMEIVI